MVDERPVVVDLKNVKKKYVIKHNIKKPETFSGKLKLVGKRILHPSQRVEKEDFWALNGITFQVRQGEKVGIIGKNGAGKSTLLKVLSRITEPTDGRIEILGKVSAMLEVGTGFNDELTGRENIYLNGAILGMTRAEIDAKFDDIVAFSEVGKFIDTPVKRYSSGMFVRLAFAVASNLDPDILIVDEVLAVGDTKFQRKCITRMMNIAESGKTILYVSHQMHTIRQLCDRVIVLKAGQVIFDGDVEKGIEIYSESADVNVNTVMNFENHKPRGTQSVVVQTAELVDKDKFSWFYNENLKFKVKVKVNSDCLNPFFKLLVKDLSHRVLGSAESDFLGELKCGEEKEYTFTFHNADRLAPGKYVLGIEIWRKNDGLVTIDDIVSEFFTFEILDGDSEQNGVPELAWSEQRDGYMMMPNLDLEESAVAE
ncbi:MAG: ABC transporter ATP-binding protein [Clostridia bacterium]|nr:ABC transporter ATP-binding protein [Clostridia bacterium]